MKKGLLLLMILVFSSSVFANKRCVDLFQPNQAPIFALGELINTPEGTKRFVEQETARLTPSEQDALRSDVSMIQGALQAARGVIRSLSQFSGSRKLRIETEENALMRPISYQLKSGQIDATVRVIQYTYSHYEINYLYAQKLESRIREMTAERNSTSNLIEQKDLKLRILRSTLSLRRVQSYLGFTFYKYLAVKEMLDKMLITPTGNQSQYAQQTVNMMQGLSKNLSAKLLLEYKPVDLAAVKNYIRASSTSQSLLLTRAGFEEIWMIVKLITLSGPVMDMTKKITRLSGAIFKRANSQHLRDTYLADIEALLDYGSSIDKQYEALRSLNSKSEKPDEFMITFIRAPEFKDTWLSLKAHGKELSEKNNIDQDFYSRMIKAEEQAIKLREYSLYYEEAGATKLIKMAFGLFTSYATGAAYAAKFPQHFDYVFASIESFLRVFGVN